MIFLSTLSNPASSAPIIGKELNKLKVSEASSAYELHDAIHRFSQNAGSVEETGIERYK